MPDVKYHLVKRIVDAQEIGKTLSRDDIQFAVPPVVGDVVFWNDEWGGCTVEYRYVGKDYVELGVGRVGPRQAQELVDAGWVLI